jgi:ADP-heptose:LPS heptosyltransferase
MGSLSGVNLQRIAVLQAHDLGGLLCAVPAFRALKDEFPKASVTLIGLPQAEVFVRRFSRYIDHFIEFPGNPGFPERALPPEEARHIPGLIRCVQRESFDLAIQMHGDGRITYPLVESF